MYVYVLCKQNKWLKYLSHLQLVWDGERNGMDFRGIFNSPIWEYSGEEWNGYEGNLIPLHSLLSIFPKNGRDIHSFTEME